MKKKIEDTIQMMKNSIKAFYDCYLDYNTEDLTIEFCEELHKNNIACECNADNKKITFTED